MGKLTQTATFRTYIWEIPGSILYHGTGYNITSKVLWIYKVLPEKNK